MSDKTSVKTSENLTGTTSGDLTLDADNESRDAAAEIAKVAHEIPQVESADPHEADDPDAIPMLTDVLHAAEPGGSEKASEDNREIVADGPSNDLSEADWNRMALQVQKSVMKSMLRRTDKLVDGNLRDQLDEFLDRSAERLMADLKSTMEQAVRESVSRAIAEELSAVRKKIKRS